MFVCVVSLLVLIKNMCVPSLERKDLFALCCEENILLPGLPDDCHFNAYLVNWLSNNGKLFLSKYIPSRRDELLSEKKRIAVVAKIVIEN